MLVLPPQGALMVPQLQRPPLLALLGAAQPLAHRQCDILLAPSSSLWLLLQILYT